MQCLGRKVERHRNGNWSFLQKFESQYPKVYGELPIIYIPGKERILACSIEQLQVKKGRAHHYSFPFVQLRTDVRSPQIFFYNLRSQNTLGSLHSGFHISFFFSLLLVGRIVGNLLRSYCLFLFPLLFYPHTEPFLWGAQDHMPQLKDLIWSSIMPCWVSDLWAELSRPADDLTRRKPTRTIGNSKKWRKCGNTKMGLWEEELQGAKGSMGGQNVVKGPIKNLLEERNPERFGKATKEVQFSWEGGEGIFHCVTIQSQAEIHKICPSPDFLLIILPF